MRHLNPEVLADRAQNLGPLNGFKLVFVSLLPAAAPDHAVLDVEFQNANSLVAIVDDVQSNGVAPTAIFTIRGGTRVMGGEQAGNIQVTDVQAGAMAEKLQLRVEPIGDYSTYTLNIDYHDAGGAPLMDPLFAAIDFKFRPGCFNLNCHPPAKGEPTPATSPNIDYLAKDFESFKHNLINAMRERVPGWAPTSEADLDQVLIDLIAADADELSDYQDRVANEAYLGRARKRVSLARHARLMDYHIHQGNQAATWLAVQVANDLTLPASFGVWAGESWKQQGAVIFATDQARDCSALLNTVQLYTWGGAVTALDAGSTDADLALPAPLNAGAKADADTLRDLLRSEDFPHLVLQAHLNPETGTVNGVDKTARQLLTLLEGNQAADSLFDPLAGQWFVRVRWRSEDRLRRRYCFITRLTGQPPVEGLCAFHGNLVHANHGRPHRSVFRPPGVELGVGDDSPFRKLDEAHYEPTPWGVLCPLPEGPLAYRNTAPGGDTPTRTTLTVTVSGIAGAWTERNDLIESQAGDEDYIVETDEYDRSSIRFGNGVNGRGLPPDAVVTCDYQVGRGSEGNVGCDVLTGFDPAVVAGVQAVWNPLDVTDGRDPELPAEIIRRVPEAYRSRQLRAVTLEDYVDRAEALAGVSHAYARYGWTGSWRTVRVSIDPMGTTVLPESLRQQVAANLEAVRLIGEDLEIRGARYVGLDIRIKLCAEPDYWPEDLEAELEREFGDGYTADGRPGFFNPDLWAFGQALHASQLIGRALAVTGVGRVLSVSMRRWDTAGGSTTSVVQITPDELPAAEVATLEVRPFEIIQVANNPDHLEHGRILFDIQGGRR